MEARERSLLQKGDRLEEELGKGPKVNTPLRKLPLQGGGEVFAPGGHAAQPGLQFWVCLRGEFRELKLLPHSGSSLLTGSQLPQPALGLQILGN